MSVFVDLFLFHKPGEMLDEGQPTCCHHLAAFADDLHQHLLNAADILEILSENGWDNEVTLYSIGLIPPSHLRTMDAVEQELRRLDLDPDDLAIFDDEEAEDTEDVALNDSA